MLSGWLITPYQWRIRTHYPIATDVPLLYSLLFFLSFCFINETGVLWKDVPRKYQDSKHHDLETLKRHGATQGSNRSSEETNRVIPPFCETSFRLTRAQATTDPYQFSI